MIEISDLFVAPQGEGPNMGRSSLFVRFHRCPLSCSWCDTAYTWDKRDPGYIDFVTYETPRDLVQAMLHEVEKQQHAPEAVVFTGGEPMIYQRDLAWIVDAYTPALQVEYGIIPAYEVETSGIVTPSFASRIRLHFNVSHKLPSAGNKDVPIERLWNQEAMRIFLWSDATFKVVVNLPEDLTMLQYYLSTLQQQAKHLSLSWQAVRSRIYLMPCAITPEGLIAHQGEIINLALQYGVRSTTRMHVTAWGTERGK